MDLQGYQNLIVQSQLKYRDGCGQFMIDSFVKQPLLFQSQYGQSLTQHFGQSINAQCCRSRLADITSCSKVVRYDYVICFCQLSKKMSGYGYFGVAGVAPSKRVLMRSICTLLSSWRWANSCSLRTLSKRLSS